MDARNLHISTQGNAQPAHERLRSGISLAENGGSSAETLEPIELARRIIRHESEAMLDFAGRLDTRFFDAVQMLLGCRGRVIVSGMGKAGLIGRKIAATLASTGTPAYFLHPAEAIHGDLGCVDCRDIVVMLSQSGETEEIVRLLGPLGELGAEMIAITSSSDSSLGQAADVVLELGELREAGDLALAPSTSTTVMLAAGDALALVTSRMRNFRAEDFAKFHPGGSLGRKLSLVDEYMRPLDECRIAVENETVREVYVRHEMPDRRTGAIMLIDSDGRLSGIFTDSDLARLFEHRRDNLLDRPISEVMTGSPLRVSHGSKMIEAIRLLAERHISELPVVDADGRPAGLVDITDVIGVFPECETMIAESQKQNTGEPKLKVFGID